MQCHVKVPASTSNLGSGFDTLGLAVQLYTTVELARSETGDVRVDPSAAHPDLAKLVSEAANHFFQTTTERFGLRVHLSSKVTIARGLGYSATVRVGVLAGLNEVAQAGLNAEQ